MKTPQVQQISLLPFRRKAALRTLDDADNAGCLGARLAGAAQNATRAHYAFEQSEELRRARLPLS
jgi:hypothetical protein